MAAWRYEISLLVLKKYLTSERSERVKYFSTVEGKFRISAWPGNILYLQDGYLWDRYLSQPLSRYLYVRKINRGNTVLSEFLLLRLRVTFDTLHLFMHVISTLVCVEIYP